MIFKIKSLFCNVNNKIISNKIFDRVKHIQNRQYAYQQNIQNIFIEQSVNTLADNLSSINKKYDGEVVYFGQGFAQFLNNIPNNFTPKKLFFCDINDELIHTSLQKIRQNPKLNDQFQIQYLIDEFQQTDKTSIIPICCDEEFWPFQDNQLQLIISNMSLHWVNDLQVVFIKWLESLEADGSLLGSMFGEDTLQELRISYTLAENERYGGVSPHISPLITITEVGNLLTRLKYTLPTICTERNQYQFDSVFHLMQYVQDIGEGEALLQKRNGAFKQTIQSMSAIYETLFKNENMKVTATFEQIYFSAWKYHEKQQQPKSRGSKKVSLHDIQKEIQEMDPNETIVYGTVTEDDYQETIIQGKKVKKD